ncbi:hypothetical protein Rhal01_02846 [Rubritalea halochordaticola]|uniref:Nucleotidyl transferase domain-containing protein n=1 Tax=Rubritalea halochordaticola TaxID=714537 RepID=A0ABP9V1U9_9BACT
MKLIILAAGKGERLWPLTKDTPKPLIEVSDGVTLLEEQLHRVSDSGIFDEVVVVTGYLADKLDSRIDQIDHEGLELRTIYNPFFDCSNNLASLWIAREAMDSDFMVTNGDNLFDASVFAEFEAACSEEGIYLSLGEKLEFDDDDMKVTLQDGVIRNVAKDIMDGQRDAESPGLCLIRGAGARETFTGELESLMRTDSGLKDFWLKVFPSLYESGTPALPWVFDADKRWREVDIHPDIDQMKQFLSSVVRIG